MSGCTAITDAGLDHLSGIHELNISRCTTITEAGLAYLLGIRILWMSQCPQLSALDLARLEGATHTWSLTSIAVGGVARSSCPVIEEPYTLLKLTKLIARHFPPS